jgi:hypothetical protein
MIVASKLRRALGYESVGSLVLLILTTLSAHADVTLTMNSWDVLPRLQIAEGNAGNCENNPIIFDGSISRPYSRTFPGTGSNGLDICFRRTRDPQNTGSPLDPTWTRCSSDGDCSIP